MKIAPVKKYKKPAYAAALASSLLMTFSGCGPAELQTASSVANESSGYDVVSPADDSSVTSSSKIDESSEIEFEGVAPESSDEEFTLAGDIAVFPDDDELTLTGETAIIPDYDAYCGLDDYEAYIQAEAHSEQIISAFAERGIDLSLAGIYEYAPFDSSIKVSFKGDSINLLLCFYCSDFDGSDIKNDILYIDKYGDTDETGGDAFRIVTKRADDSVYITVYIDLCSCGPLDDSCINKLSADISSFFINDYIVSINDTQG